MINLFLDKILFKQNITCFMIKIYCTCIHTSNLYMNENKYNMNYYVYVFNFSLYPGRRKFFS